MAEHDLSVADVRFGNIRSQRANPLLRRLGAALVHCALLGLMALPLWHPVTRQVQAKLLDRIYVPLPPTPARLPVHVLRDPVPEGEAPSGGAPTKDRGPGGGGSGKVVYPASFCPAGTAAVVVSFRLS